MSPYVSATNAMCIVYVQHIYMCVLVHCTSVTNKHLLCPVSTPVMYVHIVTCTTNACSAQLQSNRIQVLLKSDSTAYAMSTTCMCMDTSITEGASSSSLNVANHAHPEP